MQATTRWYKDVEKIRFSDGTLATVVDTLKHGFLCLVRGKGAAFVWTSDLTDDGLTFSRNSARSRTGIAKTTVPLAKALKQGQVHISFPLRARQNPYDLMAFETELGLRGFKRTTGKQRKQDAMMLGALKNSPEQFHASFRVSGPEVTQNNKVISHEVTVTTTGKWYHSEDGIEAGTGKGVVSLRRHLGLLSF